MGKYTFNLHSLRDEDVSKEKLNQIIHIANELAEANRLKRLELNLSFLRQEIVTTPTNSENFGKEICEDRA